MPVAPQIVAHCRNVLSQHAAWMSVLPGLDSHGLADQVRDAALLLDAIGDCCRRTYPNITCHGSQCEEDTILAELLPEPTGVYVDLGAGEPMQCSNTWQFYKRGWRGLLVEPHPAFVYQLARWRPGDCVFPVAVSDRSGMVPFYVDGTVSSCQSDWSNSAPDRPQAVECMTATDILALPDFQGFRGDCSLCSIDVEGHERHVLTGIPWDVFTPKVFCVEYLKYATDDTRDDLSPEWEPILLEHGYTLHATTLLNKIYIKQ